MNNRWTGEITGGAEFAATAHVARLFEAAPGAVPRPMSVLAGVLSLCMLLAAGLLYRVPWIQTAAGVGRVVALDPADRLQQVNVLVDGRINRWFVQDGSVVEAGDPIVEISDIDPHFLDRLHAEREALAHRLEAARSATETAKLDVDRQRRLLDDGLSSRRQFEAAQIKFQELTARQAEARAALNVTDIGLSRRSSQIVRAPQDGRIVHIAAGNTATLVAAGDVVATFAPTNVVRTVEIFVSGLDAPLVQPGMRARIMFEGWPAIQFSGWPHAALGTFAGVVHAVDPAVSANGRFRVLVIQDTEAPWPPGRYLRLGGQAKAWVQLSTVRLGYELWRKLNQFPSRPAPRNDEA